DPIHHLIEATPPPIDVYAVCRGGCGIITFDSSHKLRKMPQPPPLPAQTRRQPSIYGCSTRRAELRSDPGHRLTHCAGRWCVVVLTCRRGCLRSAHERERQRREATVT